MEAQWSHQRAHPGTAHCHNRLPALRCIRTFAMRNWSRENMNCGICKKKLLIKKLREVHVVDQMFRVRTTQRQRNGRSGLTKPKQCAHCGCGIGEQQTNSDLNGSEWRQSGRNCRRRGGGGHIQGQNAICCYCYCCLRGDGGLLLRRLFGLCQWYISMKHQQKKKEKMEATTTLIGHRKWHFGIFFVCNNVALNGTDESDCGNGQASTECEIYCMEHPHKIDGTVLGRFISFASLIVGG